MSFWNDDFFIKLRSASEKSAMYRLGYWYLISPLITPNNHMLRVRPQSLSDKNRTGRVIKFLNQGLNSKNAYHPKCGDISQLIGRYWEIRQGDFRIPTTSTRILIVNPSPSLRRLRVGSEWARWTFFHYIRDKWSDPYRCSRFVHG